MEISLIGRLVADEIHYHRRVVEGRPFGSEGDRRSQEPGRLVPLPERQLTIGNGLHAPRTDLRQARTRRRGPAPESRPGGRGPTRAERRGVEGRRAAG